MREEGSSSFDCFVGIMLWRMAIGGLRNASVSLAEVYNSFKYKV
jgi:hypothetical protein